MRNHALGEMGDPDRAVRDALEKHRPDVQAVLSPGEEDWLSALWSEEYMRVEFGCKLCQRMIRSGEVNAPSRYCGPG